jgi:hypothetical protein
VAEKHQNELARKGVVYINSDSNAKGTLGASGSHSLEFFISEVLRDLKDPKAAKACWMLPARDAIAATHLPPRDPRRRDFTSGPWAESITRSTTTPRGSSGSAIPVSFMARCSRN